MTNSRAARTLVFSGALALLGAIVPKGLSAAELGVRGAGSGGSLAEAMKNDPRILSADGSSWMAPHPGGAVGFQAGRVVGLAVMLTFARGDDGDSDRQASFRKALWAAEKLLGVLGVSERVMAGARSLASAPKVEPGGGYALFQRVNDYAQELHEDITATAPDSQAFYRLGFELAVSEMAIAASDGEDAGMRALVVRSRGVFDSLAGEMRSLDAPGEVMEPLERIRGAFAAHAHANGLPLDSGVIRAARERIEERFFADFQKVDFRALKRRLPRPPS